MGRTDQIEGRAGRRGRDDLQAFLSEKVELLDEDI